MNNIEKIEPFHEEACQQSIWCVWIQMYQWDWTVKFKRLFEHNHANNTFTTRTLRAQPVICLTLACELLNDNVTTWLTTNSWTSRVSTGTVNHVNVKQHYSMLKTTLQFGIVGLSVVRVQDPKASSFVTFDIKQWLNDRTRHEICLAYQERWCMQVQSQYISLN